MFTKDTEYALIVIKHLKENQDKFPISLRKIVDVNNLKLGFAEQVSRRLRKKGFISSMRGPGGGYVLTDSGKQATVWDIMWAVELKMESKIMKLLPQSKKLFYECQSKLDEVVINEG